MLFELRQTVLALESQRAEAPFALVVESDLCDRLPYDVAFWDLASHQHRILFREHARYDSLQPQSIEVRAPDGQSVGLRSVILERRMPGEEKFGRYMQFTFEKDIQGPVTIAHDHEAEFAAKDASGQVGTPCELFDRGLYQSPAQRGDL